MTDKKKVVEAEYDGDELVAASLPQLIAEMTSPSTMFEKDLLEACLLTYPYFTSGTELFNQIVKRLFSEKDNDVIALRCINIIRTWIEEYFHWFFKELPSLSLLLANFVDRIKKEVSNQQIHEAATGLSQKLDAKVWYTTAIPEEYPQSPRKTTSPEEYTPPPSSIIQGISDVPFHELSIHDIDPIEIARQLCLIESKLYSAVKYWELIGLAWLKNSEKTAPHVNRYTRWFNSVVSWAVTVVVTEPILKHRVKVLVKLIETLDHLVKLNNFNGILEITSALHSLSVPKLKKTWAEVPKNLQTIFKKAKKLTALTGNFKKIRKSLEELSPPCLPYLGIAMRDLIMLDEAYKNSTDSGLINLRKRVQMANVIKGLKKFQGSVYNFTPVKNIQEYLMYSPRHCLDMCLKMAEYLENEKKILELSERKPRPLLPLLEKQKSRARLLFLGLNNSGKSTIFKQMHQILHGPFIYAYVSKFKAHICEHSFASMQLFITTLDENKNLWETNESETTDEQDSESSLGRGHSRRHSDVSSARKSMQANESSEGASPLLSRSAGKSLTPITISNPHLPASPSILATLPTNTALASPSKFDENITSEESRSSLILESHTDISLPSQNKQEIESKSSDTTSDSKTTTDECETIEENGMLVRSRRTGSSSAVGYATSDSEEDDSTPKRKRYPVQRRSRSSKKKEGSRSGSPLASISSPSFNPPSASSSPGPSSPRTNLSLSSGKLEVSIHSQQVKRPAKNRKTPPGQPIEIDKVSTVLSENTSENVAEYSPTKFRRRGSEHKYAKLISALLTSSKAPKISAEDSDDDESGKESEETTSEDSKFETDKQEIMSKYHQSFTSKKEEAIKKIEEALEKIKKEYEAELELLQSQRREHMREVYSKHGKQSEWESFMFEEDDVESEFSFQYFGSVGGKLSRRRSTRRKREETATITTSTTEDSLATNTSNTPTPGITKILHTDSKKRKVNRNTSVDEKGKRRVKKSSSGGSKFSSKAISWSSISFTNKEEEEKKLVLDQDTISQYKKAISEAPSLTPALADMFTKLWRNGNLKRYYYKVAHLLPQNAAYFFEHITRIATEDYLPSPEDIMHSYTQTTGITYKEGEYEQYQVLMADIGGGRVEQRKWANFLEEQWDAIIYVVGLDQYDSPLETDNQKTYLEETLRLWKEVSSLEKLQFTTFFLIFNKSDRLITKLSQKSAKPFPIDEPEYADYNQTRNYAFAIQFLKHKFAAHFGGIHFVPFVTNALEKTSCEKFLSTAIQLI